jgi:hypothetical protein
VLGKPTKSNAEGDAGAIVCRSGNESRPPVCMDGVLVSMLITPLLSIASCSEVELSFMEPDTACLRISETSGGSCQLLTCSVTRHLAIRYK